MQERTSSKGKPEDARDYALVGDPHWRTTLNTALRLVAWRAPAPPTPADVLLAALKHVEAIPGEEFDRLAALFNTSKSARRGAVRARVEETRLAGMIAERLAREAPGRKESERLVVVVALYAYGRHVISESQRDLVHRLAAYVRRAFRDPAVKRRVLSEASLSAGEAEAALELSGSSKPLGRTAGRQFADLTRMIEVLRGAAIDVVHAATVAPTDDDFFEMVDEQASEPQSLALA